MDTGGVVAVVLRGGPIAETALCCGQGCDVFFFEGLVVAAFEHEGVAVLLLIIKVFSPGVEGGEAGGFCQHGVEALIFQVQERQATVTIAFGIEANRDAAAVVRGIGLFAVDVVGRTRVVDKLINF